MRIDPLSTLPFVLPAAKPGSLLHLLRRDARYRCHTEHLSLRSVIDRQMGQSLSASSSFSPWSFFAPCSSFSGRPSLWRRPQSLRALLLPSAVLAARSAGRLFQPTCYLICRGI